MKTRLLVLMLCCIASIGYCQKFKLPENYSFETLADYKKFEPEIVKCAEWLERTKYDENDPKIVKANNFLAEWLTGCPYLNYPRNVRIDAVFSNNPQLKVYFKCGWVKSALNKERKADKIQNVVEGMRAAIAAYKSNKAFEKDANFVELMKVDAKGQLKEWVIDRME